MSCETFRSTGKNLLDEYLTALASRHCSLVYESPDPDPGEADNCP